MRLGFAGTPEFAARVLQALLDTGHRPQVVLTQPDRPAGRGLASQPSAVKKLALAQGIAVAQPQTLRTVEGRQVLADADLDVLVVVAYGLILPVEALTLPRWGCLNVHASLLPRWRGAAPLQRAILAGDAETGVCIMQMDAGLDTGPVVRRVSTPIAPDETTESLHDRLATLGGAALCDVLARPGPWLSTAQPEAGVTYAAKIDKAEARINWARPAVEVDRQIRAFNPIPGAWGEIACERIGVERVKVWQSSIGPLKGGAPGEILAVSDGALCVACGEGSVLLGELQRPGQRRGPARAFCQGLGLGVGDRFA
ncbi:MAG: methionyl-tRNA formyltransferase [Rhodocyclaceae bacterium]|nr:methionyl-tRNA formyltransferase [Rhodocyclaceae bacterium]